MTSSLSSLCAPNINLESHFTCFTKEELISIIKAFNNYIINKNLCKDNTCIKRLSLITILPNENQDPIENDKIKKRLWGKIYNRLKPICKYEDCWVNLDFINKIDDHQLRNKLKYFTFKPKFYANRDLWLNTTDIEAVMKQYQKKYPEFYFIGAKPCDFYKYTKLNLEKWSSYKKLGIVFNLDKTGQPGSHWTSLFIDRPEQTRGQHKIYYFDSTGKPPNKDIHDFILLIARVQIQKNPTIKNERKRTIEVDVYINNKVHQKGNSECGVYSIYFLIQKLKTPMNEPINTIRISDKDMKFFRKYIFNIESNSDLNPDSVL